MAETSFCTATASRSSTRRRKNVWPGPPRHPRRGGGSYLSKNTRGFERHRKQTMYDDAKRLKRLQEEPRRDVAMGYRVQRFVEALQTAICKGIERYEPETRFRSDRWEREGGGGGLTRVLEGGQVFEKAGVNTSAVFGVMPERTAAALRVEPQPFFATGISLVIHPQSPCVPTVHANFRYFALGDDLLKPADQWFGGGAD